MKRYLIIAGIIAILIIVLSGMTGPMLVLFGVVAFVVIAFKRHTNSKILNQTLREIDRMSGEEFEHYVAKLFRSLGYNAQVTKTSGDYGADVIATRFLKGKSEKIAIQCKRYQGKVGISAVQEVIGAKAYYDTSKAYVITNSYFTQAAKNLACRSKVVLWDRDTLQTRLNKIAGRIEEENETEDWE